MKIQEKFNAHRDDGKRYAVRAGEKLTAFLELEAAIRLDRNRNSPCRGQPMSLRLTK